MGLPQPHINFTSLSGVTQELSTDRAESPSAPCAVAVSARRACPALQCHRRAAEPLMWLNHWAHCRAWHGRACPLHAVLNTARAGLRQVPHARKLRCRGPAAGGGAPLVPHGRVFHPCGYWRMPCTEQGGLYGARRLEFDSCNAGGRPLVVAHPSSPTTESFMELGAGACCAQHSKSWTVAGSSRSEAAMQAAGRWWWRTPRPPRPSPSWSWVLAWCGR